MVDNSPVKVNYQLVANLSLAQAIELFSSLTFPNIARYAQAKVIAEPLLGVVAKVDGQAQGLLLAEVKGSAVKVLTWFVHEKFRNQGIGEQLLIKLEKVLLKNKTFKTVFIDYDANWPSIKSIESFFDNNQWQLPTDNLWMCATVRERISQAPWLYKAPRMSDLEIFSWQDLTLLDRQQIIKEKFYPPVHDPFKDEERIAYAYSYGVRKKDKVIGWLITHQISATAIQYSNFFIDAAYRKNAYAISLLIKAINQQVSDHQFDRFVFQVAPDSSLMPFLKKRLEPYLIYKSIMKSSCKVLMGE